MASAQFQLPQAEPSSAETSFLSPKQKKLQEQPLGQYILNLEARCLAMESRAAKAEDETNTLRIQINEQLEDHRELLEKFNQLVKKGRKHRHPRYLTAMISAPRKAFLMETVHVEVAHFWSREGYAIKQDDIIKFLGILKNRIPDMSPAEKTFAIFCMMFNEQAATDEFLAEDMPMLFHTKCGMVASNHMNPTPYNELVSNALECDFTEGQLAREVSRVLKTLGGTPTTMTTFEAI